MSRAFLFAICLGLCGSGLMGQGNRWPSTMAFLDVERVVVEYKKTQAITKDLEAQLREKRLELRQRQADHEEKMAALKVDQDLDVNDLQKVRDRIQTEKTLAEERVEIEIELAIMKANTEQRLADHLRKVYSEIREVSAKIARQRGIQVIHMVRGGELGDDSTKQGVMTDILVRPVVYFSPELDLTSTVIEALNK